MQKRFARRWWVEELEDRRPASALGPGVWGEWLLPRTAAAPAAAPARTTAGPGSSPASVAYAQATSSHAGAAPAPNVPTAATRATRAAAPAAQTPAGVALSGAFGQDCFRPPLDTALADPLGGAANPPRAAGGAAGAPAAALAPLPLVADAPPPAASAPVPAAKGAAGPAPAAPSLPLLPPAGTHAGPGHRGPAAPKTRPFGLDPDPGPMMRACTLTLNAPAFIPVSADDDNGSAVTPAGAGIPAQRDFDVAPIPGGDPELLPASVTVGCNVPGELEWTVIYNGPPETVGTIDLWTDNTKSARAASLVESPGNSTYDFNIEGVHESSALNDLTLQFTYTYNITGTPTVLTASQDITVNPLINSFTATPGGGAYGQNVRFVNNEPDGSDGLQAVTPAPANIAGMQFAASVNNTNLPGDLTLVQNYENLTNGAHNTKYPPPPAPNGQPVGWLYADGTVDPNSNQPIGAANLVIKDGAIFPLLDVDTTQTLPDYEVPGGTLRNTPPPPPGTYTIRSYDAPTTAHPVAGPSGIKIDLLSNWTMWLLWRYHNTVGGQDTLVYYPIAKINWKVDWLAHATRNNGNVPPISFIDIPHGVTADPNYTPTNQPPDTMSPTTTVAGNPNPVSNRYNGNTQWVTIPTTGG